MRLQMDIAPSEMDNYRKSESHAHTKGFMQCLYITYFHGSLGSLARTPLAVQMRQSQTPNIQSSIDVGIIDMSTFYTPKD